MKQFSLHTQQGASVTSVVLLIIALGLLAKLGFATIPDYVADYQLNKLIQEELKKANDGRAPDKVFLDSVANQLKINGNHTTNAREVIRMTSKTPGGLTVLTNYSKEHIFYGNTVITNRFSAKIDTNEIIKVEPTVVNEIDKLNLSFK